MAEKEAAADLPVPKTRRRKRAPAARKGCFRGAFFVCLPAQLLRGKGSFHQGFQGVLILHRFVPQGDFVAGEGKPRRFQGGFCSLRGRAGLGCVGRAACGELQRKRRLLRQHRVVGHIQFHALRQGALAAGRTQRHIHLGLVCCREGCLFEAGRRGACQGLFQPGTGVITLLYLELIVGGIAPQTQH